MAYRVFKHIANTVQGIEDFLDSLPFDVHILGQPTQFTQNGKRKWIVWYKPMDRVDSKILRTKR